MSALLQLLLVTFQATSNTFSLFSPYNTFPYSFDVYMIGFALCPLGVGLLLFGLKMFKAILRFKAIVCLFGSAIPFILICMFGVLPQRKTESQMIWTLIAVISGVSGAVWAYFRQNVAVFLIGFVFGFFYSAFSGMAIFPDLKRFLVSFFSLGEFVLNNIFKRIWSLLLEV